MEDIDLNHSPKLPKSAESLGGATANAMGGCSKADAMQGFCKLTPSPEPYSSPFMFDDAGGFLERPHGWER